MKSLKFVVLAAALVAALVLAGCSSKGAGGTASGAAATDNPADALIGKWVHTKLVDGSPGSGATVTFSHDPSDQKYPYRMSGDLGNGAYSAGTAMLSFTPLVEQNGVLMVKSDAKARNWQFQMKDKDTFVLEDHGEFAREGSPAIAEREAAAACLKTRTAFKSAQASWEAGDGTGYTGTSIDEFITRAKATGYLDKNTDFKCPSGGTYTIDRGTDGKGAFQIQCSIHSK